MFWEGFISGFVACILAGIASRGFGVWWQARQDRNAYIAGLTPKELEGFKGYMLVFNDWRAHRDMNASLKEAQALEEERINREIAAWRSKEVTSRRLSPGPQA